MAPIWSKQPFKALLTLITFLGTPPYLVCLALYYVPKSFRPHPEWSISRSLANALLRTIFNWSTRIRAHPTYLLEPEKFGDRFVRVQPGPEEHYTGVLADSFANPALVTALWYPKAPTEDEKETFRFVLHLPGGAFVLAADPTKVGKDATDVLAEELNAIIFYAQYRIARDDSTRFPAALQDAVSFYQYMLDLGIPSKNIIISGDSAGGNLALALTRYIEQSDLPKPLGTMGWSPWLAVSQGAIEGYKRSPHNRTDFLSWESLEWGVNAYTPKKLSQEQEPYVSPAQHSFATSIPLFIQAGTGEIFLEEIKSFSEKMGAIAGNKIKVFEISGAMHNILQVWKLTGFQKEVRNAAKAANNFFM